jgi:catechol 2,3-dioxygenase-like lactoylglutathione lyase family enzyme
MANSPMFKRINLCVADLDRSLAVYRDILGFSVDHIKESKDDSYSYPVFGFPKEAKLRFATLNTGTQERTLALTEVTGIELPKMPMPRMVAAVINCPAFDDVLDKARAAGLEVVEPQILPDPDGNAKGRESAFVDPDGHLVVIYVLNDQ